MWARSAERLTAEQIASRVVDLPGGPEWVTISGGNPALYDLSGLCDRLGEAGYKIAVETQGTRFRRWLVGVGCLVVSPKPPSSTMARALEDFVEFERRLVRYANTISAVKIVCFDERDLEWARRCFAEARRRRPTWQFFLSVGTDRPGSQTVGGPGSSDAPWSMDDTREGVCDRYSWLCDRAAGDPDLRDVRVLPQLHVLAYGHKMGV